MPFQTLQLKFVMERLIARLFHAADAPWLLKGGFAMDLRFRPKARTTKDIDLSVTLISGRASAEFRDRLQAAADTDLGDHLSFRIGELKATDERPAGRRAVPVRGGAGREGVRQVPPRRRPRGRGGG